MTSEQIHTVRKSFALVERLGNVAALVFYRRLFELAPHYQAMFRHGIEEQSHRLLESIAWCVSRLDHPGELQAGLAEMGARHVGYGVHDEDYAVVGQAFVDMLATVLRADFPAPVKEAWLAFYGLVSGHMMAGAAALRTATAPALPARHGVAPRSTGFAP